MKKRNTQGENRSFRLIMGANCLKETLRYCPKRILEIYCTDRNDLESLSSKIQEHRIPIQVMKRDQLERLVNSRSHQGLVAKVKEVPKVDFDQFTNLLLKRDKALILALDSIEDPQNLGALLRAAECFGVDAVIWSKNRGVGVTPVVSKVSCGASELIPIITVSNLAESLRALGQEGFEITGAMVDDKAIQLSKFKRANHMVLVVGSEGNGLRPLIQKLCKRKVAIALKGKIESLNVSQATSILLAHLAN